MPSSGQGTPTHVGAFTCQPPNRVTRWACRSAVPSPHKTDDSPRAQIEEEYPMRKQCLVLGVAMLLVSGGIASAQSVPPVTTPPSVTTPNASQPETTGQSFRDDRLQSDRDSIRMPTPAQPPAMVQPRNIPDPNPLPGEEPRPIPR